MTFSAHFAPDTADVIDGYQELEKSVQAYYILMAACGIHSSEFFRLFSVPPEKREILYIKQTDIPGMQSDVVVIENHEPAGGNWRIECACFPPELEKAVRNFTVIWTPDHYKRSVRRVGQVLPISAVRQWNYSIIYQACLRARDKLEPLRDIDEQLLGCRYRVNLIHGNIAVSEQSKKFDHKKRMVEAIITYSYAAKEIAESLSLPEYILNGETYFESPRISPEDRAKRDKKVVEMLKAKTPSGGYTYTHLQIKKETGITSSALNALIAKYHLERGMVGGRAKGLPKPRKNKGV